MPRTKRMIISGQKAVYHIMSRTALDGFPIGDIEKEFLFNIIKKISTLYFVDILWICCMGNHFHGVVQMNPDHNYTDEEIQTRYKKYYGDKKELFEGQIPFFREKLSSISDFTKEVKLQFTRFYNKRHGRCGFFWGSRFKSVIVEKGETLINLLAYVDLNPVRAGIVKRPEEYRWNTLGYLTQTNNKDNFLSFDFGLKEFNVKSIKERIRRYRRFVYETGAIDSGKGKHIKQNIVDSERKNKFELTKKNRFKYRTRYFTDSGIIGTKDYVQKTYLQFKDYFQTKNDKVPKRVKGLSGVYSLKRLTE